MDKSARKAAVAAYKERKVRPGIYAVRCPALGRIWVGAAHDISTIENRLWFGLREATTQTSDLIDAYRKYGREGIAFEVVETLDEEANPYFRGKILSDRSAHWRGQLGATAI